MNTELRLREVFRIHQGFRAEGPPVLYEVEGLPNARIESLGPPKNRWRIMGTARFEQDKERDFATPEEALATLQQESD
jgi:hypothetical protein